MIDVSGGWYHFPPIEIGGYKMLDVANPENIGVMRTLKKYWEQFTTAPVDRL
jgi:hypothetical protein